MKRLILVWLIPLLSVLAVSMAGAEDFSIGEVQKLVPRKTGESWWHKRFSSMPGNRYMTSFNSNDHKGNLDWDRHDLKDGKIAIVKAMQLALEWTAAHTPFGESNWEVENVTYRFRSGTDNIEYICSVTLKTPEYKTIEIIVLPNSELIPPVMNPEF